MGAAEVSLGRLHRDVAQKKLDLLQLAAGGTTKPSATPSEIVRRELGYANLRSELLDDVPNEFLRHPFAPDLACAAHASEEATTCDSGGFHPLIQEAPHPIGYGDGSNVARLSTQVNDCPMTLALLKMIDCQTSEFVTPEAASQKNRK